MNLQPLCLNRSTYLERELGVAYLGNNRILVKQVYKYGLEQGWRTCGPIAGPINSHQLQQMPLTVRSDGNADLLSVAQSFHFATVDTGQPVSALSGISYNQLPMAKRVSDSDGRVYLAFWDSVLC